MNQEILFTINEACRLAKSGRTALYEAIKSGNLRALKRGRRTVILARDLEQWIQSLPEIFKISEKLQTDVSKPNQSPHSAHNITRGGQ